MHIASGGKRILLSLASPRLQSANKRMAVFPQRVAGGPKSPSCSMPTGLKNVPSATVKKRFARSDESQADKGNSCLIFPEWMSRWQLITWSILRHLCPIFLALPPVLHPTKPAYFTWIIEENMKQLSLERKHLSCLISMYVTVSSWQIIIHQLVVRVNRGRSRKLEEWGLLPQKMNNLGYHRCYFL